MTNSYDKLFSFIVETEKLKNILRKTKVIGVGRFENSAEHSWTVSLVASILQNFLPDKINTDRIIKMLLIHDIVEIDAGDKFIYSDEHHDTENETNAAKRIFGILPEPLSHELINLWIEYELRESVDSKHAYLIDRLVPLVLNINNEGQSWRENNISFQQVVEKNEFIASLVPDLWEFVLSELKKAKKVGWLRE